MAGVDQPSLRDPAFEPRLADRAAIEPYAGPRLQPPPHHPSRAKSPERVTPAGPAQVPPARHRPNRAPTPMSRSRAAVRGSFAYARPRSAIESRSSRSTAGRAPRLAAVASAAAVRTPGAVMSSRAPSARSVATPGNLAQRLRREQESAVLLGTAVATPADRRDGATARSRSRHRPASRGTRPRCRGAGTPGREQLDQSRNSGRADAIAGDLGGDAVVVGVERFGADPLPLGLRARWAAGTTRHTRTTATLAPMRRAGDASPAAGAALTGGCFAWCTEVSFSIGQRAGSEVYPPARVRCPVAPPDAATHLDRRGETPIRIIKHEARLREGADQLPVCAPRGACCRPRHSASDARRR